MNIRCLCGNVLDDTGYPNNVEHLLLSTYAIESLQDEVDQEVSEHCAIDLWPEHWEKSGAIEVWKCFVCGRLYINPKGNAEDVVIYKIEKKGLNQEANHH